MKSELARGVIQGRPWPRPVPVSPPAARPKMPRTSWPDPPKALLNSASLKGCSQASTRAPTWAKIMDAATAPMTKKTEPMAIQLVRPVAT